MTHSSHTHTPTPQTAPASAATQTNTRRRNSSAASSASSCPSVEQCPAATPPSFRQDPLAALERALLAHPTTHRYWHRRHHSHDGNHLAPPSPAHHARSTGRSHGRSPSPPSRSPSHSPMPSSAARRCMEATDAWTPSLDRRQSWDGQAHRRAMMIQATGLGCTCHPEHDEAGQDCKHSPDQSAGRHHHRRLTQPLLHMVTPQNIYESDRGFSEVHGPSY
ncbi:hypothetical protein SEPCBS57363_000139 [Sporothrix epigloea]|uniref:Uncharacterized protein n=1 Tax=Sporothrix epigloea TaxID=1892477 RepID=A0ABP0D2Y1_9PEZI